MKLSDYVMEFIARQGVRHVFTIPGGGCMHLVDSLGRNEQLEFICTQHEQAAAIATDAYAQYRNGLAVALVTTGPGGTNALTGVAGAWLDSTPCMFLSGQVKTADIKGERGVRQMGFQEIDVVSMATPITKLATLVTDPRDIRYVMERSAHVACGGRPGPVWVDIPLDVQAADIDPDTLRGFEPDLEAEEAIAEPGRGQVRACIELLNAAERPVLLVGNGVRLAGGEKLVRSFAEHLGIPVVATWKALDLFEEDHPLFFGRPGAIGQRGANFTQQNSDFILIIGARLDLGQTGYSHENFARGARKVMVDIDIAEIEKMDTAIDVAIHGDARRFMQAVLADADGLERKERAPWFSRCRDWKQRYPVILPEYWDREGFVDNYVLIDVLSDVMAPGELMIPGSSGACSEVTMQAFKTKRGTRVFNTEGLGPMGFGIAAALGGCIASGGRRTICLDGDGGFSMNIQELETLHRLGLPIKIFVLNNRGYGSIRASQRRYFDSRFVASGESSGLSLPDVVAVAGAYGLRTLRITDHSEVRAKVREALEGDDPVIIDINVSPAQETLPRLMSEQRPDGSMVSKPLEDLYPFLDRDEFRRQMIVPPLDD